MKIGEWMVIADMYMTAETKAEYMFLALFTMMLFQSILLAVIAWGVWTKRG